MTTDSLIPTVIGSTEKNNTTQLQYWSIQPPSLSAISSNAKVHLNTVALAFSSKSISNALSDSRFLLAVWMRPPKLNSRSTGPEEGIKVLNFMKTFFTFGYLFSIDKSVSGSSK